MLLLAAVYQRAVPTSLSRSPGRDRTRRPAFRATASSAFTH